MKTNPVNCESSLSITYSITSEIKVEDRGNQLRCKSLPDVDSFRHYSNKIFFLSWTNHSGIYSWITSYNHLFHITSNHQSDHHQDQYPSSHIYSFPVVILL